MALRCIKCGYGGAGWQECPECRKAKRGAFATPPQTLKEVLAGQVKLKPPTITVVPATIIEPEDDEVRPPAKFYAPKGECAYCDLRRLASRRAMRRKRRPG